MEPPEPSQLVVELRAGRRIAVRQIEAADQDSVYGGLDLAAMPVVSATRQSAAREEGHLAFGEDRNAVPAFLAMQYDAVTGALQVGARKTVVRRLQFLQAGDIG